MPDDDARLLLFVDRVSITDDYFSYCSVQGCDASGGYVIHYLGTVS